MALTEILGLSSAAAKVAGEIAEDAKNKRLINTGKAASLAENLGQIHAKLMQMQVSATRIHTDVEFRDFVRDHFRDDE
jgi:hypothetical protein